MSDYEDRIQAKRDRYAERAARARSESTARHKASRDRLGAIPPGQPILVGHHSERRHRRDLARADRDMRAAIDADKRAAHLQHKAETYGTHGISSDDPAAIDKLTAKLARMEAQRAQIKAENKAARKAGTDPHPSYVLTNLGANIRRVRDRIAQIKRAAEAPERGPVEGDGFTIEEDKAANRLRIYFDTKPGDDLRRQLKSWGFKWARSVGAWQRHLSPQAWCAARTVLGISEDA